VLPVLCLIIQAATLLLKTSGARFIAHQLGGQGALEACQPPRPRLLVRDVVQHKEEQGDLQASTFRQNNSKR
jgi:hypothetical protein